MGKPWCWLFLYFGWSAVHCYCCYKKNGMENFFKFWKTSPLCWKPLAIDFYAILLLITLLISHGLPLKPESQDVTLERTKKNVDGIADKESMKCKNIINSETTAIHHTLHLRFSWCNGFAEIYLFSYSIHWGYRIANLDTYIPIPCHQSQCINEESYGRSVMSQLPPITTKADPE